MTKHCFQRRVQYSSCFLLGSLNPTIVGKLPEHCKFIRRVCGTFLNINNEKNRISTTVVKLLFINYVSLTKGNIACKLVLKSD